MKTLRDNTILWLASLGMAMALSLSLSGCEGGSGSSAETPATPPPATVTAPSISSAPAAVTTLTGQPASFTVNASGTAPLSYQWQRDGVSISGATAASYTLTNPTMLDSGARFQVVVSNSAGSATSSAAELTVQPVVVAPAITVAPQAQSVRENSSATLIVAASGTAPFGYRWFKNGSVIDGATSAAYTTPTLVFADATALWTVEVSNSAGAVTSAAVQINVTAVPAAVATQPQAVGVIAGQTASFSVVATGSAPLTYQWRRNGTPISGATATSYTTPVTTLADDGALYSVVVNNDAGVAATSSNARLTVAAAAVAPSFTTAPSGATVSEGQSVTFSAAASGTAPIAYQWLRNGVDITGATAATYAISAAALIDNGARFSVRASNRAGQVVSSEVVLTVNAATGGLVGRAWATGQLLETDDNSVLDRVSGIDDAGRVTVVFRKSNGTRDVVYATRGTPNGAGAAPTWSTPVPIDLLAGAPVSTMGSTSNADYDVLVTPSGNAVAYWFHSAPCTASTYLTSGTCRYYYLARFTASSGNWSAPELIGDAPSPRFGMVANDRGDIALAGESWVRSGTTSFTRTQALFMRNPGEASFRRRLLNTEPLGSWILDMDASGNVLLAAEYQQNGTTDLVAYRGTIATGLTAPVVLDTRGAVVKLLLAKVGLNGQQAVLWTQNNGVGNTTFAATAASPTETFSVTDLGFVPGSSLTVQNLFVTDDGKVRYLEAGFFTRLRREWTAASGWSSQVAIPSELWSTVFATNRRGDILAGNDSSGAWGTYDAERNVMVQTISSSTARVLGVSSSAGYGTRALSINGVGFLSMQNKFDLLPTSAAPAGDGRPSVTNLWGAYLK